VDKFYLYLFYSFRFLIQHTPDIILNTLLNFFSWLIYKIDLKHKKVAYVNLDLAYGDKLIKEQKDNIIKRCYKNLLYLLVDFVRNQGISKEDLLDKIIFENDEIVKDAIKNKQRIIFLTAHYGNWELLGLAISAKFIPMTTVGRDLDSPTMNTILEANRKQLGMDVISKNGAMKGMIKALKNNHAVGILVDQNTKNEEGLLIDFFGKKARHTPSVALIAKKFNALIIPAYISTDDYKKYRVKFYEPFVFEDTQDKEKDILDCVQKQADITQKVINEKPDEWFWLHQRWKNQYEHLYK
jgi:KDO2-lipid IV(A) lauroyltransferase